MLRTEGRVTMIDGILAAAVLLGLVLNAGLGWWWADPAAGYVLVYTPPARSRRSSPGGTDRELAASTLVPVKHQGPGRAIPASRPSGFTNLSPSPGENRTLALLPETGHRERPRGGDGGKRPRQPVPAGDGAGSLNVADAAGEGLEQRPARRLRQGPLLVEVLQEEVSGAPGRYERIRNLGRDDAQPMTVVLAMTMATTTSKASWD